MTASEDDLCERLRDVEDPALGEDVVSLGLIEDVRITDDGVAEVVVEFNAPGAPDESELGDGIRHAVADLGLEPSLSVSRSWREEASPIPDVRNVVPIASGKGGVGKTTVATNLAAALADEGLEVGLLDADIYGPNVPATIGIEATPGVTPDGDLIPPEALGIRVMSLPFLTEEVTDPAVLRGPMIDSILSRLFDEVEWGELDYLLVDLPPGTGDAQLSLLQTVPVTGAAIVTTPEDVALEDVRKGIRMFVDRGTPVLGVIENMSAFECEQCGHPHELYGSGGGRQVADEFDVPLLAELPFDPAMRADSDVGPPLAALGDGRSGRAFAELRDDLLNRIGAINRGVAGSGAVVGEE